MVQQENRNRSIRKSILFIYVVIWHIKINECVIMRTSTHFFGFNALERFPLVTCHRLSLRRTTPPLYSLIKPTMVDEIIFSHITLDRSKNTHSRCPLQTLCLRCVEENDSDCSIPRFPFSWQNWSSWTCSSSSIAGAIEPTFAILRDCEMNISLFVQSVQQ